MFSECKPYASVTREMVDAAYIVFAGKMLMHEEDRDLIERVLAAALSDQWRDIASVPTPVDHARTTGICKDDDKLTWWQDGNPTHWMPLPAAPKAEGR